MPAVTFLTPPERLPDLQMSASSTPTTEVASAREPGQLAHSAINLSEIYDQQAPPLVFEKRSILTRLTSSPRATSETFAAPAVPSRDAEHTSSVQDAKVVAPATPRKSLLSNALEISSGMADRNASVLVNGTSILRKDAETSSRPADVRSEVPQPQQDIAKAAHRPKLHFIEPRRAPFSSRLVASVDDQAASKKELEPAPTGMMGKSLNKDNIELRAPPVYDSVAEVAPKKRSLVFQEHAEVIERAAERAAKLSSQALEQHSGVGAINRSRQHSTSSAGDETASTRSSWARRSSSRGSSADTSPAVVSAGMEGHISDLDLKPAESNTVPPLTKGLLSPRSLLSQTSETCSADGVETQPLPRPKLTFVDASARPSRSVQRLPSNSTLHADDKLARSQMPRNLKVQRAPASTDDERVGVPASANIKQRALSFSLCPKPDRTLRESPGRTRLRPKAKLSASPAPHTLSYRQRLKGIRGDGPLRSPAPGKDILSASRMYSEDEEDSEQLQGESSGYSEDEEDSSGTDDSDRNSTEQNDEDEDEEAASSVDQDEISPSNTDEAEADFNAPPEQEENLSDEIEEVQDGLAAQRHPGLLQGSLEKVLQRKLSLIQTAREQGGSEAAAMRKGSSPTSPRRDPSETLSPKGKLKTTESSSHPMCFLPDTFEDSYPPTPSEQDSDAYEPPRSNLLQGWLSEGSAASSRRASWQQLPTALHHARTGPAQNSVTALPISTMSSPRGRDRATSHAVMSDGEQSRSLGGNAAFILESAGYPCSPPRHEFEPRPAARLSIATASAVSRVDAQLGVSADLRPVQPFLWRHVSSQHQWTAERPASASAYARRGSNPATQLMVGSTFTSPVGSYTRAARSPVPFESARHGRPQAKQRAVSASGQARSRASIAPCSRDIVIGATSPPCDDAFSHLQHCLAQSPPNRAKSTRSPGTGASTPGWMSEGQSPTQGTGKFWSERLSSLAQAMTDELSHVGNAMLGHDIRAAESASVQGEVGAESHQRPYLTPLNVTVGAKHLSEASPGRAIHTLETPHEAAPFFHDVASQRSVADRATYAAQRPKPIRITSPTTSTSNWSSDRDGLAAPKPALRSDRSKRRHTTATLSDSSNSSCSFRIERQEIGEDGHTRLIVVQNSDQPKSGHAATRRKTRTRTGSMEFDWGKCKLAEE